MDEALDLARQAMARQEVPIGCVVVHNPTRLIIGRGYKLRETTHDPSAHAEIVAMRQAGQHLGHWRLCDCTLVVTLEPCAMCAGAMVNARIDHLVYGCDDPKAGAVRTLYTICQDPRLNHRLTVTPGIRADESADLLRQFFRQRRGNNSST